MNAFYPNGVRHTEPPSRLSYRPSAGCLDDQSVIDQIRQELEGRKQAIETILSRSNVNCPAIFIALRNELVSADEIAMEAVDAADQSLTDKDMGDRWL